MKMREQDFKKIPQRKDVVAILKKLNDLPENGNPHPYFEKMMLLMSGHLAQDIVPAIYPHFVGFAMERNDFSYLNFLANIKLGFYMRGDLTKITGQELREYLGGMFRLRSKIGLIPSEEGINLDENFKSIYLWNALMIYSNSTDILALSRQGRFEKPFKVKCPHCDNDIHSLCINVDAMEHTSHITPAEPVEFSSEVLFFDDIYSVFKGVFDNFQEKYFSRVLPYVYGTYECSQCHQSSQVIEAMKKYQFQEAPPFIPTDAFLNQLEELVLMDSSMHPIEHWMITQFIVSGYRGKEGDYSLNAMKSVLRICVERHQMLGLAGEVYVLREADKILSNNTEKSVLRGEVLSYLTLVLSRQPQQGENILEYHQEIVEIYQDLLGEDHEKTLEARLRQKIQSASMDTSQEMEVLTEFYQSLPEEYPPFLRGELEQHLASLHKEKKQYTEAVHWQKKIVAQKEGEYGAESFRFGLIVQDLAQIYELMEENSLCEETYLKALDIMLTAFRSEFHLSESFQKEKPQKKKERQSNDFRQQMDAICGGYGCLGEFYFNGKEYQKSFESHEKAMDLWDFMSEVKGLESAAQRLSQAVALEQLGEMKKAKTLTEKAVKILEIRLKHETNPELLELAENGMENGKALLERLK